MQEIAWSEQLRVLAARMGDAVAVTDGLGQSLSYAQLSQQAHALAQGLIERGFVTGQSVGVWLPNSLDAVRCAYGIRLMGAAETPLSWTLTASELQWCCGLAQVHTVITRAERAEQVRACGLQPLLLEELHAPAAGACLPAVPASATGRILFTSGTTGKPKAVRYTHGARWVGEQMLKAAMPFVPDAEQTLLLMTPFVHGASLLTFAWCDAGGHVLLHDGVDTERIEPLLAHSDVPALFAPPTVLAKITRAFAGRRFVGVRCIFTGTQAMTETLYQATHAMFGPVVRITYGKSECVNPITVLSPAQTHAYFSQASRPAGACVGWPVPGVSLRIAPVSADEPDAQGEVLLRAPQQCADLIGPDGRIQHDAQGWHATGDLGFIDEAGRLVLTGRVADVIKTGGYRVNPDEIEAAQTGGALYGAVCVTALASDYWGEVIVTVVQDAQPGWEEEARHRVQTLSRHKQPRLYVALPALARNAQGKVSRKQVAQAVLAQARLIDGPYPRLQPLSVPANGQAQYI
jgi:O-succinylbenzoic acid--CoA ligase